MARIVKEQDYAMKRAEILDVAQRLIYTKGYEQMSIQDILDALQISKGAFYHYFESKQALLEALIERMVNIALQVLDPIINDPDLPAITKLQRYFNTAARWKTDQKEFMLELLRIWYADENALVRQKLYMETVKQIVPSFTAIIKQGVREGVFTPAYPDYVSELILTLWETMGSTMADVFLEPAKHPDGLARLKTAMGAYTDAMERLLGASPGSIILLDMSILDEWFEPPEKTMAAAAGGQPGAENEQKDQAKSGSVS